MKKLVTIMVLAAMGALAAGAVMAEGNPMIAMETSEGKMVIELYKDKAPITVQNFLWYVDNEFYDGLIFHRVIKGFMIQGGGFSTEMKQKVGNPPIDNEATNGVENDKYTIAMARTGVVNSATSQFFINSKNNGSLNHRDTTSSGFGYCVFGKVISGMDVVDTIESVPTGNKNGMGDVPRTAVILKSVYRCDEKGKKMKKDKKD